MWQTAVNLVIAIWLIVTGLRHPDSPGVLIFTGIVVSSLAFYIAAVEHSWQAFVIGIIGLWLFYSAIQFHLMTTANLLISGIATLALGIWVLVLHALHNPHEDKPAWS